MMIKFNHYFPNIVFKAKFSSYQPKFSLINRSLSLKAWVINEQNSAFKPHALPTVFENVEVDEINSIAHGGSMFDSWLFFIKNTSHFAAVINNRLYTWGANDYGQLGPANTGFSLFESGGDEESIDSPFLMPGSLNTRGDQTLPLKVVAGHFHTVALDRETSSVWSWGAGLLGKGTEVYDPLPAQLTLFSEAGIDIQEIEAAGDYSIAVGSSKKDPSKSSLVYMWGYFPTPDFSLKKARYPALVHQLKGRVHEIIATPQGFGAIINKNGSWYLQWYGSLFDFSYDKPYYPTYSEEAQVANSFSYPPEWSIQIPQDISSYQLLGGWGYLGLIDNCGNLLVFDVKNCDDSKGFQVFGSNNCKSAIITSLGLVTLSADKIQFCSSSCFKFTLIKPTQLETFSQTVKNCGEEFFKTSTQTLDSLTESDKNWYSRLGFKHNYLWAF